jgi:hypothetical protein
MDLERVFDLCSLIAVAGWLCLLLAPVRRTGLVAASRFFSALLCIAYLIQLLTITEPTGGDFTTLRGVTLLFSAPGNVMLGWTHYLAFDLFTGSWEIDDAGREGLPHWVLVPILFLTFMLGPVGLLVYLVVRTIDRVRKGRPALAL